ncbi:sodium:proton antiporter [Pannus brasiliensis CCIBt3594]|uniref:Sodium:proton antiporter n=1 Tax=Pannus brasiliensis CCIBt3594 TaxID=1427578 RepID=A0AAW9QQH0_9CHRO
MSLESTANEAIARNLEQFLLVLSISLSVATLSRTIALFRKIPYTLLLVIVGLGLAFVDVRLIDLSPELILEIFLPPLLFEAAWNIPWRELKQNWLPIALFAIIGVIISVLGVAYPLHLFAGAPFSIALLLGAALAATDPVSVIALFKELGASRKLTILMEGESLFNDGVAVVAFVILVGIPLGTDTFSVPVTVARFCSFVGIGVGIGCVIGFGISYLTQRFDLPFVEQSLTLVSAYGTYLVTEQLGGSGVIGVVIVGIILGNLGSRIGMNPRTRLIVTEFWEFIAFFVNSIIFLLIGDQTRFDSLGAHSFAIAIAISAVVISRLVSIFGLGAIGNALTGKIITASERTVLWWGGLRGSVSIALALSVPNAIPYRQEIIDVVFGVVLFTLLVQGLSIQWLLKVLNLIGDQPVRAEYSALIARQIALTRVANYLQQPDRFPDIDPEFHRYKRTLVEGQLQSIGEQIRTILQEYPRLKEMVTEQFQETLIDIEADTYAELIRSGRLSENLAPVLIEAIEVPEEI